MSPVRPPEPRDAFVDRLLAIEQGRDRASLGRLRRGAGRPVGSVPEASSVVFPLLPAELRRPWEVNDCWLVATLFSLYPRSARPGKEENLGATLARLDRKKVGGAERHIMAILGAHREDLDAHLRRVVLLARSHEVAIDYHRLLRDLRWWTTDTGNVQRAWSLDFWAGDLSSDPSTTEGAQSP